MILVDVHNHLDHDFFKEDLDQVIERAREAGVKSIITNGLDPDTNRKSLELANKYDIVKAALGIYPPESLEKEAETGEHTRPTIEFDIDKEIEFIEQNKDNIIAIGEIGLDFVHSQTDAQKELFKKLLDLAKKLDKPVLVHSRKAEREVIEILEANQQKKVILHCFSGRKSLIKRGVELGYYFSIPGNIVRSQQFQITAELVPFSQLLTETDGPYMSPFKDKRNEPAFIIETIKKIAEIKNITPEETANQIYMNYQHLF